MGTVFITLLGFTGGLGLMTLFAIGKYNSLVLLRNRYKNGFAQLDFQLKRRYDLITTLAETVATAQQCDKYEMIILARDCAYTAGAKAAANPGNARAIRELSREETNLNRALTRLFAAAGINILRQAHMPVQMGAETLNLIGVDFQSLFGGRFDPRWPPSAYLQGVESLVMPDTANILLSHNPNTFDRAAELGIDLTLAGHTHGGQVSLEFIHSSLSPSHLITPYVRGWFQKGDSQLYVNRGIGILGVPARFGARPEITVLELTRT